jgi:hypothetical protein
MDAPPTRRPKCKSLHDSFRAISLAVSFVFANCSYSPCRVLRAVSISTCAFSKATRGSLLESESVIEDLPYFFCRLRRGAAAAGRPCVPPVYFRRRS